MHFCNCEVIIKKNQKRSSKYIISCQFVYSEVAANVYFHSNLSFSCKRKIESFNRFDLSASNWPWWKSIPKASDLSQVWKLVNNNFGMSRCAARHWNNFSVSKQEECLNAKKLDRFTQKQKCTKTMNNLALSKIQRVKVVHYLLLMFSPLKISKTIW